MTKRILAACLAASALSACTLPNSGPDTAAIAAKATVSTGAGLQQRYEIVDITQAVTEILGRRPPDSFRASFGDYRAPIEPRIGVGDMVNVTIWEAAAGGLFSAPLVTDRFSTGSKSATIPDQAVARDGTILVPYAGRLQVAGMTPRAVEDAVVKALDGKAIQPQALVSVSRSVSNAVTVTGEVAAGARIPLSLKGDRLLDVVAAAGGVRASVVDIFVRLSRGGRTVSVPLQRVVADPRENIYMRPDDVLTLVRDPQTFVATGATGANAEIPFDAEGISLSQAMGKAGGLQDYRADPKGVFLFRYESPAVAAALLPASPLAHSGRPVPIVYRIDLTDPNTLFLAQRFPVFDRDVIYASNASITDAQKALQVFNMLTAPVGTAASIGAATK